MARIIKDAEERRAELLEIAGRMFYEIGYEETSVQAITDAVGLAKGTFYHYFNSKEDLLGQLADSQAEDLFAALHKRIEAVHEGALEELRTMIAHLVAFKGENRQLVFAYLRVFYRDENIVLRHKFERSYLAKLAPFFAHVIGEGAEERVFDVEDPEEASELLLSLLNSLSERLGLLVLSLDEYPENMALVMKAIGAAEVAMGRILGVKREPFKVYDIEAVKKILAIHE